MLPNPRRPNLDLRYKLPFHTNVSIFFFRLQKVVVNCHDHFSNVTVTCHHLHYRNLRHSLWEFREMIIIIEI